MGKFINALEKRKKDGQIHGNSVLVEERDEQFKTNHAPLKKGRLMPVQKDEITPMQLGRSVDQKVDIQSGSITHGKEIDKIDKKIVCIKDPNSFETELFKMLRGRILFPVSGKSPRSILVTSATPSEGKSFTASNLAVALAQTIGEYVLLVDCDLRKPSIHEKFGLGHVKGLSEYLSNSTTLSNLIIKTPINKLSLLPAGIPPDNPSEILSSIKMADLVDELKLRYSDRYLIIDTPPLLLAPETNAIAKNVDGIILVINCRTTPFNLIEEVIQNLDQKKIIGAVVNRYDMPSSKYYGYKKYRKYYKKNNDRSKI